MRIDKIIDAIGIWPFRRPPRPPDPDLPPDRITKGFPPAPLGPNYVEGGHDCPACGRFYVWPWWHRLVRGHWPTR